MTLWIVFALLIAAVLSAILRPFGRKDGIEPDRAAYDRAVTPDLGHPKLREHMASVVTAMKLSNNYEDFRGKIDMLHPRYDDTIAMEFMNDDANDSGEGL